MTLADYIAEFKSEAESWFARNAVINTFHLFFQQFFKKENLEKAEWEDFQKMGEHIHSFNSMALAKKKALGKPNHPIEHYRRSLLYLVHGEDAIEERIRKFKRHDEYRLKNFGDSAVSELLGWAFPDRFVMFNERDRFAVVDLLKVDPKFSPGDDFVERFLKFNRAIQPLAHQYREVVGQISNLPLFVEIDQFLSYLYEKYHKTEMKKRGRGRQRFWVISPGHGAEMWEEFLSQGVMAIGWDSLGDLRQYESKEQMREALQNRYPSDTTQSNNALTCFDFSKTARIGEYIFAKAGRKNVIGFGRITSDYVFDASREKYRHVRSVEWLRSGNWDIPEGKRGVRFYFVEG